MCCCRAPVSLLGHSLLTFAWLAWMCMYVCRASRMKRAALRRKLYEPTPPSPPTYEVSGGGLLTDSPAHQ